MSGEPGRVPSDGRYPQNDEGQVVIDAVHERFRQMYIHCDDCDKDIVWDNTAIKNHFNGSHPSSRRCRYCGGKVFMYRKNLGDNSKSQEYVYHKCERERQTHDTDT